MCVCVCVCVGNGDLRMVTRVLSLKRMHVHVRTCARACFAFLRRIEKNTKMFEYTCVSVGLYIYIYIYIYILVRDSMHVCVCVVYACMYACMQACARVNVRVRFEEDTRAPRARAHVRMRIAS